MGINDKFIKTEERMLEKLIEFVSADDFLHIMGWGGLSSTAAHNAGDAIDVEDSTAQRFIERIVTELIASKPAEETAEKKVPRRRNVVKRTRRTLILGIACFPWGLSPRNGARKRGQPTSRDISQSLSLSFDRHGRK